MYSNAARQGRIAAKYPSPATACCRHVEVNDLGVSVHATIGATRAVHAHRRASNLTQRALEYTLHRHRANMGLNLPAIKPLSVILYTTRDPCVCRQRIR